MKIVYDPVFLSKLKKVDVRIKNSTMEKLLLFSKDPNNLQFNNHPVRDKYQGYRSIDITADYRALYKERYVGEETVADFTFLGTHDELYGVPADS